MRCNGTFRYTALAGGEIDEDTGFVTGSEPIWIDGCECQIDKSIPATNYVSADGQAFSYNYDVFIDKSFESEISIGSEVEVTFEDGSTESFTVQGIDNANRKYLEIWG